MPKSLNYEVIKITVNGKPTDIKIKKDLAWGELIEIMRVLNFGENQGIDSLLEALHVLLKVGTIDSPIDADDRTSLMQLSAGDVTRLVGEIRRILPLEQYLRNLGLTTQDLANQTTTKKKPKR